MSFGKKLKQLRKERSYTQEQMSSLLSMEQSSYSRYETNKASPNLEVIKRVAEIFGIKPEWLVHDECTSTNSADQNHTAFMHNKEESYNIPKEIIESILSQQKKIDELLKQVLEKK